MILAGIERAFTFNLPGVFTPETASALFGEVYHYLRDGAGLGEEDLAWVEGLRQAVTNADQDWLYSRNRTRWPFPVLRAHRGIVTSVPVVDEHRVVSGGKDGQ